MKEQLNKKTKRIIAIFSAFLLLILVGACSWGIPVLIETTNEEYSDYEINPIVDEEESEENQENNPDLNDLNDYIKVTYNDYNGKHYSFTLSKDDLNFTQDGMQVTTNDYIYTYGYYWSENDAKVVPTEGSLVGWTKQSEDDKGWGVSVKDRTKKSYEGVYDKIADQPVNWLNGTFYNCIYLEEMPLIPSNARHTDYMFYNCTALQSAILPSGITTLGSGMFYKCTSLQYIYIPKTVQFISEDGYADFRTSLSEDEIIQSCRDATKLNLPAYCISETGNQFSIVPDNGILACCEDSYYFISATAPNYVTINGTHLYLRSAGSDGESLWVFCYNKETGKWEQILDYPGGNTDIIPSYQNGSDPMIFTDIIYTSHDLYREDDKTVLYRKADTTSFLNGVYYGYETEFHNAFKSCNPDLKIYCEHETKPDEFVAPLLGKSVEYNIPYPKMIEIKYNVYKGI